jgi:hypothetical protein
MIRIEVTGDTPEEVLAQLRGLAGTALITVKQLSADEERAIANAESHKADDEAREALQAERDAKKPARKPKAAVGNAGETPPATAEEAAPEPETATEVASPSELSFDTDVAPVVLRKVQTAGKPAVEAVLSEFGVDRASQLEAARWPELLEKLEDLG